MAKSYHNTNDLNGEEYNKANRIAETQEDIIYAIMKDHKKLTRTECHRIYVERTGKDKTPESSIGRGLTNLKTWGMLALTTERTMGQRGAPVKFYELIKTI